LELDLGGESTISHVVHRLGIVDNHSLHHFLIGWGKIPLDNNFLDINKVSLEVNLKIAKNASLKFRLKEKRFLKIVSEADDALLPTQNHKRQVEDLTGQTVMEKRVFDVRPIDVCHAKRHSGQQTKHTKQLALAYYYCSFSCHFVLSLVWVWNQRVMD
jgi:hypothetical protein